MHTTCYTIYFQLHDTQIISSYQSPTDSKQHPSYPATPQTPRPPPPPPRPPLPRTIRPIHSIRNPSFHPSTLSRLPSLVLPLPLPPCQRLHPLCRKQRRHPRCHGRKHAAAVHPVRFVRAAYRGHRPREVCVLVVADGEAVKVECDCIEGVEDAAGVGGGEGRNKAGWEEWV